MEGQILKIFLNYIQQYIEKEYLRTFKVTSRMRRFQFSPKFQMISKQIPGKEIQQSRLDPLNIFFHFKLPVYHLNESHYILFYVQVTAFQATNNQHIQFVQVNTACCICMNRHVNATVGFQCLSLQELRLSD